jgi:quinoprotein glucose dehydrogenase
VKAKIGFMGAATIAALLCGIVAIRGTSAPVKVPYATWSDYGGGPDGLQYSGLKQIDKSNVNRLALAWNFPVPFSSSRFGFNPVIVDNVMYVLGKDALIALDAVTGKQIWIHPTDGPPTDRGINYWESKRRTDRRLIFAADSFLQEIDARTGITIPGFGNDGRVDLRVGLGRDPKTIPNIQTGTPGHVFENLIILGSATSEAWGSPPGDLRAYDVHTGKMAWIFHTVPHPGELGYETWPKDAWKYVGGTNTWGEMAVDQKRGIGYFPIGSPTYDFYGADRVGANLFGDCLLALDLRTGKRLWHYQVVHHDLWDYDPATGPKLLTVRHNGKLVDIVAQAGKTGYLYVFNRVTGEPLWPIQERPVPKSEVPGEESWPTQPIPTNPPSFARQKFTVEDLSPYLDPAEKEVFRQQLMEADNQGIYTPPSHTRRYVQVPGDDGGSNWGNGAADPETGILYLRSGDMPQLKKKLTLKAPLRTIQGGTPAQLGRVLYPQLCEGCHGPDRKGVANPKDIGVDKFKKIVMTGEGEMPGFTDLTPQFLDGLTAYVADPKSADGPLPAQGALSGGGGGGGDRMPPPPGQVRYYGAYHGGMMAANGLPAVAPPWTTLTAYDLNEGIIKWQIPLGVAPGLAAKGIKDTGAVKVTLAANRNGPVVTAGGLIFIGTWSDRTLRAFDKDTGKILWEKELEANPEGVPSIYEIGGREYIVFCASGRTVETSAAEAMSWTPGKPEAQGYYVFTLPREVIR